MIQEVQERVGRLNRALFNFLNLRVVCKTVALADFVFVFVGLGECFTPFPDRLGRFTSGQELQVFRRVLSFFDFFSKNRQNDLGSCETGLYC